MTDQTTALTRLAPDELETLNQTLSILERNLDRQYADLSLCGVIFSALDLPIGEALKLTVTDLERTRRAVRDQRGDILIEIRGRG